MTADLLPCPFCANTDLRLSHLTGGVFCENCGCDGPWSPAFDGDWNTRAAPSLSAALALPEVSALVVALNGMADAFGCECGDAARAALAALKGRGHD